MLERDSNASAVLSRVVSSAPLQAHRQDILHACHKLTQSLQMLLIELQLIPPCCITKDSAKRQCVAVNIPN